MSAPEVSSPTAPPPGRGDVRQRTVALHGRTPGRPASVTGSGPCPDRQAHTNLLAATAIGLIVAGTQDSACVLVRLAEGDAAALAAATARVRGLTVTDTPTRLAAENLLAVACTRVSATSQRRGIDDGSQDVRQHDLPRQGPAATR